MEAQAFADLAVRREKNLPIGHLEKYSLEAGRSAIEAAAVSV
jgi:hypothetical protein